MKRTAFNTPATQRSLVPCMIILGCVALFTLLYALPFQSWQSIDAASIRTTGLYPTEKNDLFSYAYTRGEAELTIPTARRGWFATSLRMAGPSSVESLSASIKVSNYAVDLGEIDQERVFYLLLPATDQGSIHLDLLSTTTRVPNDSRKLGVLLDWIKVESLSSTVPPAASSLWLVGALLIIWVGTIQLPMRSRWRYVLLVCSGGVISIGLGLLRSYQSPLQWYVVWGSTLFTLAILLYIHAPSVAPKVWRGIRPYLSLRRLKHSRLFAIASVVTPLYVVWRLGTWMIAAVGLWFSQQVYGLFPLHIIWNDTWHRSEMIDGRTMWFTSTVARLAFIGDILVNSWLQWDGHRYLWIAMRGTYEYNVPQPNVAFFPLYPLLTRGVMTITGGDGLIAAMFVSQIALYAGLLVLYDLVAVDFNTSLARRTLLCLLLFPTAVFLGAIYTESLAIALAVTSVWAMRRERWWLAGAFGFLLALCRLPGVLIAPVIALAYLQHHHWRWRTMLRPAFLASALPLLGLGVFMAYQWRTFGTPFAFFLAQKDWNNRTSPPWVLPLANIQAFGDTANLPLEVLQFATWLGFIGLAVLASRWLPLPYTLTMLFMLLPPYLSSWHRSFSRYVLPAFPAFIVIAMLCEHRWVRNTLIVVTLPFLIGAIVLFVNGFWMG